MASGEEPLGFVQGAPRPRGPDCSALTAIRTCRPLGHVALRVPGLLHP